MMPTNEILRTDRSKTVAILQSSYIPWKGYFHIIQSVDEFIFLEDVQFTTQNWRSRNRIKYQDGQARWLTVPVRGGRKKKLLSEIRIDDSQDWRRKHLEPIRNNYKDAPHFPRYFPELEQVYLDAPETLSTFNISLIRLFCRWLGIETRFRDSREFRTTEVRDARLLEILEAAGATRYLSGPSAKAYIREELFIQSSIELSYMQYPDYPEYRQISEPFVHEVSVLDLLFMKGPDAPDYIWGRAGRTD